MLGRAVMIIEPSSSSIKAADATISVIGDGLGDSASVKAMALA
jgi:hypothetical protein